MSRLSRRAANRCLAFALNGGGPGHTDPVTEPSYHGVVAAEVTFLFADLAGFTALTEAHGDLDAADVADRFYAIARACLGPDTRLVKTIGDAVMVASAAIPAAVETALRLAAAIHAEPAFPLLRVGMHAGQAIERHEDFIGAAVNLAARVTAHARSGQILCTAVVAQVAQDQRLARVTPAGRTQFKNVAELVELFELAALRHVTAGVAIDPVCRMGVVPEAASASRVHDGRTFYFCSTGCAERFAAAPDRFAHD